MAFEGFAGGRESRDGVPAPVERKEIAGGAGKRSDLIDGLRQRIRAIEQVPVSLSLPPAPPDTGRPRSACVTSNVLSLAGRVVSRSPSSCWDDCDPTPAPHPKTTNDEEWKNHQEAWSSEATAGTKKNRARSAHQDATGTNKNPARSASAIGTQKNWTLGAPEIDAVLPWGGLRTSGLHEVRPATYQDSWAALGFALALAARRMADAEPGGRRMFLWAGTDEGAHEFGLPYGPGLRDLGLDPGALLMVRARRARDVAWVLEECLKSRALLAVLGHVTLTALTSARRLALAAAAHDTPCLLVSGHRARGLGPALTRWRVAAAASAGHPFDTGAPGAAAWRVVLERCRSGPQGLAWTVEWSDEAYDFRVATPLADRAPERRGQAWRGTATAG